jgi:hypothetical protein
VGSAQAGQWITLPAVGEIGDFSHAGGVFGMFVFNLHRSAQKPYITDVQKLGAHIVVISLPQAAFGTNSKRISRPSTWPARANVLNVNESLRGSSSRSR